MAKEKAELNKKIVLGPRITEKAVVGADKAGVYAFNVTESANKHTIAIAIKEAYKVAPEKVRVLSIPREKILRRGKHGVTGGGKKAYVYLRKGDKIEIV